MQKMTDKRKDERPQIERIMNLTSAMKEELLGVWEEAVRSSHHFLTEADINYYRTRIRNTYFDAVDLYVIKATRTIAFMGLSNDMVEMLFVRPSEKGKGYGTALLDFALHERNIHKIDVNEDNADAYGFYLKRGYRVTGRDETDADGKPFPIVHLEK